MVDSEVFRKATNLVIDKLEGGYLNPAWHNIGDSRYATSGETMFGIDRLNGGTLNTSEAGKKFWAIIDANKTPLVWTWNYRGGAYEQQLKDLVAQIMQPAYEQFSKSYMSAKLKEIVDKDPRLLFNFIYSAWNGSGWFSKFSKDLDGALAKGINDSDSLVNIAMDSRIKEGLTKGSQPNSLIKQGGDKIKSFIDTIPGVFKIAKKATEKGIKTAKENIVPTIIITAVIIISTYTLIKNLKKKK